MMPLSISQLSPSETEAEIENLSNLLHQEFKTVRLYAIMSSLADAIANPPAWWTPTAKAVARIALGLRVAYGLGLLHGAVKASNILFDADPRIQIGDLSSIRLDTGADGGRLRDCVASF
jgi:serine/threonine protein kinase